METIKISELPPGTLDSSDNVPFVDTDGTTKRGNVSLFGDMFKIDNLSGLANTATARTNIGLGNVDNTSDASKPVSTAQQTALNGKEDITNKSTSITTDQGSDTKYPSVKSIYDWAVGLFATITGSQTLTNKTIALGSNTVSGTTAQFNAAITDGDMATLDGTETLTNKSLQDASTYIVDNSDSTKKAQFQASGISTATTRTITIPNKDGTLAMLDDVSGEWTHIQTGSFTSESNYSSGTITSYKWMRICIIGECISTGTLYIQFNGVTSGYANRYFNSGTAMASGGANYTLIGRSGTGGGIVGELMIYGSGSGSPKGVTGTFSLCDTSGSSLIDGTIPIAGNITSFVLNCSGIANGTITVYGKN